VNWSVGTGTGWIDIGIDLDVQESKEIFANFGLAIHVSNVLESAILHTLFLIELVPNRDQYPSTKFWTVAVDRFFDAGHQLTFGSLVRRIIDLDVLNADEVETLKACTKVRNHLAHRFMREQAEFMYDVNGRRQIISSCENAVALFEAAHIQMHKFTDELMKHLGIDADLFEKNIEQGMRELIEAGKGQ
jgi:hypothetical protein